MDEPTLNIIGTLVQVVIALLVILTIAGIPTGIGLLVTGSKEKVDPKRKRKYTTWGIISMVAPIVLLFVILSVWGLIRILTNTFQA